MDSGQTALVMVIAVTILLDHLRGDHGNVYTNNAPILAKASLKRYAYRALASGLNAYSRPSTPTHTSPTATPPRRRTGTPSARGSRTKTGAKSAGTDMGNGVIPEFYMFDNPQADHDSNTGRGHRSRGPDRGAAGYPGKYTYYSTIAKFIPANDFLNAVWWSNYESSDFPNGNGSDCDHFWQPTNVGGAARNANNLNCTAVEWQSGDQVYGPVFSNDSLYTGRKRPRSPGR